MVQEICQIIKVLKTHQIVLIITSCKIKLKKIVKKVKDPLF